MQAPRQERRDADALQASAARTAKQASRLADARPVPMAHGDLAAMANNSPRVVQQRALGNAIHDSARMAAQRQTMDALRERQPNNTGLPKQLKSGIEPLSRTQANASLVNDDPLLEQEADRMGDTAARFGGGHGARTLVAAAAVQPRQHTDAAKGIVQGYFTYGPRKIDSAEKLSASVHRHELGSSKVKPRDKEALLTARWNALEQMAISPENEGHAAGLTQLKSMASAYANAQKVMTAGISASTTGTSGKPTVSVSHMLATGSLDALPEHVKTIVQALIQSGRVFPEENILSVAKSATAPNGGGFVVELQLAKQLLDSRPDVYLQLGVLTRQEIEVYLGFVPAASTIHTSGLVGGDLTVWTPPSTQDRKSTFIQSKTANQNTVRENVLAASNQLAARTASGNPTGKHAQREFTYTGPHYEGVIYVKLIEDVDIAMLDKVAAEAIWNNPNYVKRVVYDLKDGYHEYDADSKSGKSSSTNALFQAAGSTSEASEDDAQSHIKHNLLHLVRHLNTVKLSFARRDGGQRVPMPNEVLPLLALAVNYAKALYLCLEEVDHPDLEQMADAIQVLTGWLHGSPGRLAFTLDEVEDELGFFRAMMAVVAS